MENHQCLTVLQSVIKPFQYFLNPKLAKEPVPPQLELIAQEILVPLISIFHQFVEDLCSQNKVDMDAEKSLLVMGKCIYYVKLDNLAERVVYLAFYVISRLLETNPGWRLVSPHFSSLLESAIFPAIVMNEKDIAEWEEDADEYIRKNLPSELEEISGLRDDLFTPRKSALNLLGVISISKGPPVAASVTSKRKKGEKNKLKGRSSMGELLVLPFLSKFPVPSDVTTPVMMKATNDYYGVLMAYGSLVDFLREQKPAYTTALIRSRVLPLYSASFCHPYLVASANWILGELVSCIPEEMSSDIYTSLLKALTMEDMDDISCYPVRVSAAGAIAQLVENDFFPPEWLPVLQHVVGRIRDNDEDTSVMFELLKTLVEAGGDIVAPHIPHIISVLAEDIQKHIPLSPEQWPQVVERGFAALSVMTQCWEESLPEEGEDGVANNVVVVGRATIAKALTNLLQVAWLRPVEMEGEVTESLSSCCIDDSSTLLTFIMSDINGSDVVQKQNVSQLLLVWANLLPNWDAWEEEEDSSIFHCIKEAAYLHKRVSLMNFIAGPIPSPHFPSLTQRSIIEGICGFVSNAFSHYPSAIYGAASSSHILLHLSTHSPEEEHTMHAVAAALSRSAFSCFREKQSKPSPLWKPLLLSISSCYLCYPDIVEITLEEDQHGGFRAWALALFSISSSQFEHGLSTESEIKLTVMTLAKLMTRLLTRNQSNGLLWECFAAMMDASVRLKEAQDEEEDDDENDDDNEDDEDDDDDDDDDDDEDSDDDDVHEETEEEFLERCAQAAIDLENGTGVEELDEEDEEQEIELGELEEVDALSIVKSLIERNHQILLQGPQLPQQLVSSFVDVFPESASFFKQYPQ